MSAVFLDPVEKRQWALAGMTALAAHGVLAWSLTAWDKEPVLPMPEPVVLVELPPESGASSAAVDQVSSETLPPDPAPMQQMPASLDLPAAPSAAQAVPVTLPRQSPIAQPQPIAVRNNSPKVLPSPRIAPDTGPGAASEKAPASKTSGESPQARKEKADYFAMVSAHLNRRKQYPSEARKARQQGVVKVRFTVDRSGNISGVSISGSSGYQILDEATLALMQRVAPLPRMPDTMAQSSVTITLPIDYSLRTR
ncbi:TonB family protein [uncultured Parasphingorhabdus sp.]|uniref:energy transducer TonB n=1 Tax=uncultured Parasphingorhabdus sp. TaxID=2709694 RepID=UPI0030D85940|tara:strand:- start:25196 stop:25954 length:759 start_codon:yes stop_codon:yes gene_type:complete